MTLCATRAALMAAMLMMCAGAAAWAEEEAATAAPADEGAVVTLEQAARAALAHYQPYQISQETVTQLIQQRRQAFAGLLPTLTLDANVTRRTDTLSNISQIPGDPPIIIRPENEWGYRATLSQPLFAGGKSISGLRGASAQMRAGEQGVAQAREELLFNVAQAYYEVLKARKRSELFEAERTRLQEHRRSAEAQLKVGQVTKTVLLRAEAELAGAEASLIRAQSDEAIALDRLAQLTGLPAEMMLEAPTAPSPPSKEPDTLLVDAEAHRPELLRSRLNERVAQLNVGVARAELFPTLSLDLTYDKNAQDPESRFAVETGDKFALLRLSFPLFEGGLQVAKIREARSEWRAAVLNTQFVEETVGTEVRTALRQVEALTGSVEQFTAQVRFAKENYELVSRQFAVGLATNIDLLDANSTLLTAEQELASATFDRDLAVLQLYKSIGRLTAHLLKE
ncbi:MAG: TolC family protein [Nitrospirota bacterium]